LLLGSFLSSKKIVGKKNFLKMDQKITSYSTYFPLIQYYGKYDSTCSYCKTIDPITKKNVKLKTGMSKINENLKV
jgi:hypothetical protein